MKNIPKHSWFTLVEVLVAMTVFAMTMVSVMLIYAAASQIALKTDINREMQQNIKSVIETIAEDVRKSEDWIIALYDDSLFSYIPLTDPNMVSQTWSAIKIWTNTYFLADYDMLDSIPYDVNNLVKVGTTFCEGIKNRCILMQKWVGPLSNGKISFTNLEFYVTNWPVPKVTINLTMRPAIKNWLRADLIQNSELHFQTTISERHLQIK